jgi:hypothetical protein
MDKRVVTNRKNRARLLARLKRPPGMPDSAFPTTNKHFTKAYR